MDYGKQEIEFCFGYFCEEEQHIIGIPSSYMMCFRFRDRNIISFEVKSFVEVHLWTFQRFDFSLFFQSPYKGQEKVFSPKKI